MEVTSKKVTIRYKVIKSNLPSILFRSERLMKFFKSRISKHIERDLMVQLSIGPKSWKRAGNKVVKQGVLFLGWFSTSASRLEAGRWLNRVPKTDEPSRFSSGNSSPEGPKEPIYLS